MDSGVDLTHGELDDADITETFLQSLPDETRADYEAGESSHGTAVTSIMAAEDNGAGFLGIAWGATFGCDKLRQVTSKSGYLYAPLQ